MNWKEIGFKVLKGAITGAIGSITTLSIIDVPKDKWGWAVIGVAINGALHGISNAMNQMKDKPAA